MASEQLLQFNEQFPDSLYREIHAQYTGPTKGMYETRRLISIVMKYSERRIRPVNPKTLENILASRFVVAVECDIDNLYGCRTK